MPTKQLPPRPNLDQLKRQAQDLLAASRAADPAACQRLREFHPRLKGATNEAIAEGKITWSDALLAIAREYGYASWARLKARVETPDGAPAEDRPHQERITDPIFRRAVEMIDDGDMPALVRWLDQHQDLQTRHASFEGGNYFRQPSLLAFVAENPVRNDALPPNIVDVARVLLDRGVAKADLNETLTLVASGRVTREAGVQIDLIDVLIRAGADARDALKAALAHGEFEAARALIARGADLTLPVAAALDDLAAVSERLPAATASERRLALAFAAQHGRPEILEMLLRAGEDPNLYNPEGANSHSTPLHQAAAGGHVKAVQVLLAYGASKDLKDTLWNSTALEWARHEGRTEVVKVMEGAA